MEAFLADLDLSGHWWWLAIGLLLILLELATGTLFLLWPGVAALIFAGVAALAPDLSLAAQITLFAALSTALALVGRGYFKLRPSAGASDRPMLNRRNQQLIGRRVTAAGPFANGYGAVHVEDSQWSARLADATGAEPRAGAALVVRGVEGSVLVVSTPD